MSRHTISPLRLRTAAILFCLGLLCLQPGARAVAQPDLSSEARELDALAREIRNDTDSAEQQLAARRTALRRDLEALRQQVREQEHQLKERRERFAALGEQERAARQALAEQEQDLAHIETSVLNAARDAEALFLTSLTAALVPERLGTCRSLLDGEGFPPFTDIRRLCESLFDQIRDTGAVQAATAGVLTSDGTRRSTLVVRMGETSAFCRDQGELRGISLLPGGELSVSRAGLPDDAQQAAAQALELAEQPSADHAALLVDTVVPDLSEGIWFAAESDDQGFSARLASGGFLVWPILFAGAAGLLIGLERLWLLLRVRRTSSQTLARLEELLLSGKAEECRALCRESRDSPACRVMEAGLDHAGAPKDVLENVFHDAILKEVPRLERFLPTLSVLGAVAPLLGLLGTVTGMINTFGMMTLFGNSDPKLMSGGISEALITTQLGLGVAIPILLLHHFLERRVDRIVGDMEEKSVAFSVTLLHREPRP